MKKSVIISIFLLLLVVVIPDLEAQCAMCKATVEGNLDNAEAASLARKLNFGILYLLAIPYLLVMGVGVAWFVKNKKKKELAQARLS